MSVLNVCILIGMSFPPSLYSVFIKVRAIGLDSKAVSCMPAQKLVLIMEEVSRGSLIMTFLKRDPCGSVQFLELFTMANIDIDLLFLVHCLFVGYFQRTWIKVNFVCQANKFGKPNLCYNCLTETRDKYSE